MIIIIVVILLGFYDRNQIAATKQMHFAINCLGVDDSTHPPATIHSTEKKKRGRPAASTATPLKTDLQTDEERQ